MITIKNRFIPFGSYTTINLFGILFTKKDLNHKVYNHEAIHSAQMIECTIISIAIILSAILAFKISFWWLFASVLLYYILYCLEYIFIRLFHSEQSDAYHDVSFEEEAYNNDDDLSYLKHRKPFSWIKYLKIKSYGKR